MKIAALLAGSAVLVHFLVAPVAAQPSETDLVERLGCMSCHSLNGKGGDRGPAWDGVGARLTPEAIKKQIVSPRARMPSFAQIKPGQLQVLVEYLAGLK